MPEKIIDVFDKEYREVCFYAWYNAGCPKTMREAVPPAKDGRRPTTHTLQRWMKDDGWRQRADAMDAQLSIAVDTEIIEKKKQDYIELAESGRQLLKGAMDYLKQEGYDSASAAVRAISVGADMVAKYSRAAEMVDSVLGKTDAQIQKEIYRLLGKNSDDDPIEGNVETETEEDVDAEQEEDNS